MLQSGHEVTPPRRAAPRAEEPALAEGILIHFVALLRHAKNDIFIIIHFLLDGLSSKKMLHVAIKLAVKQFYALCSSKCGLVGWHSIFPLCTWVSSSLAYSKIIHKLPI